jgi:hypothetical protein
MGLDYGFTKQKKVDELAEKIGEVADVEVKVTAEERPEKTTDEDKDTVWIDEVMVRKQSFDLEPVNQMFAKVHEYVDDMAKQAKEFKVIDEATMQTAIGMGTQAKQYINKIEKTRKEIKAPYLAFGKQLDTLTKAVTKRLESIQEGLREKIRPIMVERKKKAEAAAKKAAEEAALKAQETGKDTAAFGSQAVPAPTGAPAPPTTGGVQTDSGSAKLEKTFEWDLEDVTKVPVEYLAVRPSLINKAIKDGLKSGKELQIPGLKIVYKDDVSMRAAKS